MRSTLPILSILLALTFACSSPSGGGTADSAILGGGKADGPECDGAALDDAGICRVSGRYASPACCMPGPATPGVDPLALAAERTNRFWGDANISSSTVYLGAGSLASSDVTLEEHNEAQLTAIYPELHYEDWPEAPVTTEIDEDVYEDAGFEVSEYVSDAGFHYSPENHEDRCRVRWQLEGVLDWLDEYRESTVKVVTTATITDGGEERKITLTTFHNQESGRYVFVYLREGRF